MGHFLPRLELKVGCIFIKVGSSSRDPRSCGGGGGTINPGCLNFSLSAADGWTFVKDFLEFSDECKSVSESEKHGFRCSFTSVCPDSASVCIDLMAGRGGGGRVFSRKQGKIIMIPRVLQAGTQQSARSSRLPLSPRILQLSVESPKMFSTAYQPREAIPA